MKLSTKIILSFIFIIILILFLFVVKTDANAQSKAVQIGEVECVKRMVGA